MAVQSDQAAERFECSVRRLTRLSSQGDYVVVEREVPYVLRAARRIKHAQVAHGTLCEVWHSTMRKAKTLFSAPPHQSSPTPEGDDTNPYDTSQWDDKCSDRDHYIAAESVAMEVRSTISTLYPAIRGHSYVVHKFIIYQSADENGDLVRDYFLQIQIDAPGIQYIFAHVRASGPLGLPQLTFIQDSHYPHAQ